MIAVARMAFALAPLMAAWGLVAAIAAIETARDELATSARRGLIASTACAAIATVILVSALLRHDFSIQYVAGNDSWHMPARHVAASLLHAGGGALLAWATLAGMASLVALGLVASSRTRTWVVAVAAGAQAVALLAVAASGNPFAATTGAIPDGAGIPPVLQNAAASASAIALLVGAAAALPPFALTMGAMATGKLDVQWDRAVRIWNGVAWTALFVGVVAGARWFAIDPARGPWLGDRATLLWLFPVAGGAWLLHLDAGRSNAERVVMRTLLVAATFVGATGAMAALSGAFVRGVSAGAEGSTGIWFAVAPVGAIVLTVFRLRAGRGALAASRAIERGPPHAAGGWLAHAGFILVLGAAIGSSFSRHHDVALADAEIFRAKDPLGHQWSFTGQGVSTLQRENYGSVTVSLLVSRDGTRLPMLLAEARSYFSDDPAAIPAPAFVGRSVSNAFVETRLTIIDPDVTPERLRISFVPLAPWLIPGAALIVLGTLVPLVGRGEGNA